MGQPSPPETHRKSRTSEQRWPSRVLILPVPLSLLALATVHDTSRVWAGLMIAMSGLLGWIFTRDSRKPSFEAAVILLIGFGTLCLSALCFLPLTHNQRSILQPGLVEPVQSILTLTETQSHVLAIHPYEASLAWGWAAACLALCMGVAAVVRTRRRSLRLSVALCATGTVLVVLHGIQWLTNATSILWVSGIPTETREAFFGTFVNPNHAGIFLAALLPISLPLVFRGESLARLFAAIGCISIAVGIWLSGSRGAALSGLGGLFMMGLVWVEFRTRLKLLAILGSMIALFLVVGPETIFVSSSQALMPESVTQDSWSFRPQIWKDCLSLIGGAPWLGVGLGGFERGFAVMKSFPQFTTTSHAHGEALQVLAETGVATGLLWISVLMAPIGLAWRQALRLNNGRRKQLLAGFMGGHTAIMLGCLVDFPLRIGSIAILFATICGVLLATPGASTAPASKRFQRMLTGSVWTATLASLLPIYAFLAPSDSRVRTPEALVEAADEAWFRALNNTNPTADLNESANLAMAGLARDPLNHRLLQRLVRTQVALQKRDEALYTLSLAQQAYPTLPWPWFTAARLYSSQGEIESARLAWHRGLSLDLPNPEEGRTRVQDALRDAAGRAEVLAMIPDRADRLRDAAIAVSQRPDQELAHRLFSRSAEIDPRVNLAFANHLLKWGQAEEAWERVQRVPNQHCHTLRTSGNVLLQLGRTEEAVQTLEQALNTCGAQDHVTLNALAKARVDLQDSNAPVLVNRLLQESPESVNLRRLQLQVLRDKYQGEEMIPLLEALVLEGVATPNEEKELLKLYELHPSR